MGYLGKHQAAMTEQEAIERIASAIVGGYPEVDEMARRRARAAWKEMKAIAREDAQPVHACTARDMTPNTNGQRQACLGVQDHKA